MHLFYSYCKIKNGVAMGKDRVGDDECDNVSLFDSILDQLGISKLTQGREKAFTHAFYNSITLILIIICTLIVVLTILQPFIKPLLWAVLCGSVLHPFKFRLSYTFKRWLCYLENSSKPLSIELASLPILILSNLSLFVGNIIISKFSAVCVGLFSASYAFSTLYDYTPNTWFCVLWKVYSVCESLSSFVMDLFQSTVVIALVLIGFISALSLLWDSKKSKIFLIASYITWISLACYVSSFFDYLRLPVLILLMTTCIFGVVFESSLSYKSSSCHTNTKEEMTPLKRAALQRSISNQENDIIFSKINHIEDTKDMKEHVTQFKIKKENVPFAEEARTSACDSETQPTSDGPHNDNADPDTSSGDFKCLSVLSRLLQNPHTSDLYIYSMCIACGVIVIVKNLWLLYFIAFLLVIHLTKLFCVAFGIWLLMQEFWATFTNQLKVWYSSRQEIIIPPPVAAFFKMAAFVKKYILSCLQNCCDAVASVTVILAVLAATIFVSTFLCIQMYTEGFYMVKVSGQIINQTVVHNPELTQLLPEGWEDQLDSALNSAYTYGRELLSTNLHRMLQDVPEDKAKELERTALELWDRVYQAWVMTSIEQSFGPKVTSTAVFQTWGQFLDGVQKTPGLMNIRNLNSLVLENMATLSSGLESVWVIVKGNASILLQAVTTLLCVVARHGAALFSFFIDVVIFLTALFYLLNSSRALYKPVEILTNMIPQHGHKLAVAMETASKEVIVASFKLLVFYGLWTWFIHSIFLMNIIYLPSVFAAILAVVPVLGTYWACLPGVLDLWLAQGKGIHALCLAICQFLPTTIVDTTIYNEIHGGHPYLTGLAVAGGVLCLGTEGAIIGPLALCGLLVVINLLSGFLQDSLSTPS